MNFGYIKVFSYRIVLVTLFIFTGLYAFAQNGNKDTSALHYPLRDNRTPYQNSYSQQGIQLKTPSNLTRTIEFDPATNQYVFREKIGNTDYSMPYSMSIEEYQESEMKNSSKKYWDERSKSDSQTGSSTFSPSLNIGMEAFDKIFGTNTINIVPQGSAELIFGVNTSKVNNPNISERLRKTTTFDFQEKIQMNVTGTIGDKLKLGVNYNTEATFDFENKTKLEYTGKEDEIIRKIEAGNVTLPLTGSLITGSQSLFGLKTELQFGKLNVTTVFSQQKGESSVIDVKGGAQVQEFEVTADNYEHNKHFFLSHYFRDHYEEALKNLPIISSDITITRIEVWVTNKNNSTESPRNMIAFLDLGESNTYMFNKVPAFKATSSDPFPDNKISGLYSQMANNVRDFDQITNYFSASGLNAQNFSEGQDYEKKGMAKKLTDRDFTFNATLGYISLNFSLQPSEVLAVAYEYTANGQTYNVGELSTDLSSSDKTLVLKLLKGSNLTPRLPNWDLMMKNVYSINAYQINKDNFQLNILYQDDKNGTAVNYIPEDVTSKKVILKALNLDRLNTQGDPYPDGVFDFVEGVTINASNGRIYFPTLEPFGNTIEKFLETEYRTANKSPVQAIKKYVYSELYDSTQTKARLVAEKNKFKIKGTFQSSVSSDIALNAINVPQGSVVVTAGGLKLTENEDYTVDYTLGRVKIINQGLLESGTPIRIALESNSLFNFQTKTMVGTHLDYKFSDNFNLGATVINLTERPLTEKVNIGDEPISNTIWGLNGSYSTSSQFLTTLVDKIPFIDTKEPSSVAVDGEFAQLIPGHSKAIDKAGSAYIDDFEGSETSIDLRSTPGTWTLASTPTLFEESQTSNDLSYGYNRAKLAWYVIDPIFLRNNSATPANIKNNPKETSSFFVKEVYETDIFKNKVDNSGLQTNIPVLNLAFYPTERGPYNYDAEYVKASGELLNPTDRWGGIQREISTTDFEAANVEFIEFWMLDPFCEDPTTSNKGYLYFNLGDVSEDVLKDSRLTFENGFTSDSTASVDQSIWGRVPKGQILTNSFADANSRKYQDIGLDGLTNDQEKVFFQSYLSKLSILGVDISSITDPSSDDFHYFRGGDYDNAQLGILDRYKNYNGPEGNSPALENTNTDYTPSSSSIPNTEDINKDNTLDESESYYQYKVELDPKKLEVGSNFVVDKVNVSANMPDGTNKTANWYQFRIPVADYEKVVGNKEGFESIRFMRMFLTGFSDSVILRFAKLDLIRGEWRKYNSDLRPGAESNPVDDKNTTFEISSVNIEENSAKSPVNYVLPPGVSRQVDPQNPQLNELNEQSMVMKINDLNIGDARAAYKTLNMDIRQYKRLQMDVHAEQMKGTVLENDELTLFIRMGSDYIGNYYEYEIPLKKTEWGNYSNDDDAARRVVWPDSNRIDLVLEDLQLTKQARNDAVNKNNVLYSTTKIFHYTIEGKRGTYSVRGNPNLSNVKTIMIGVRYPQSANSISHSRSAEIWVNELRLNDFKENGGWAANLRVTTKLADFATVSVSGSTSKPGFGSIDQKINERSKEEVYQYDVASNLELGKFLPEKSGIQIPTYVGVSETFINPQYNPLDPDIELKTSLKNAKTAKEREELLKITQDYTSRKSLNFTNVRVNKKEGKQHFYDVSNLSANYAYNETNSRNINIEYKNEKHFTGGIMYSFQLKPKAVTPFQKIKFLRGKPFGLIRDFNFNYLPSNISFRTDMNRNYSEMKVRNINNPDLRIDSTVNKDFLWNRYYDVSYDLTRQLKIDFSASNTSRIDEPIGGVNRIYKQSYDHWKDSVWSNIKKGGRSTHYQHDIRVNYGVPVQKIPLLGWTSLNLNYTGSYDWTVAPIVTNDTMNIGNTISNSGTLSTTGQFNFVTLYNKVPYFRKLLQPKNNAKQNKRTKKVVFEKDRINLVANQPRSLNHKLGSQNVKVMFTDTAGIEIKGKLKIVSEDKVTFTPDVDYKGAKAKVEATVELMPNPFVIIIESVTRAALGVKNISISWSRMRGSTMPGFMPNTKLMGMSGGDKLNAPGLAFIVGIVDKNFGQKAIDNGWLSTSEFLNNPYTVASNDNVTIRSSIEPFPGLKIEVTGNHNISKNGSSYFSVAQGKFTNYIENGSFSMSFIALGSSFEKVKYEGGKYLSNSFSTFKNNRIIIAERLANNQQAINSLYNPTNYTSGEQDGGKNGFGMLSQEVLIPSFMAAYGGIDPKKVTLKRFPSVFSIMPNWRISYDGLTKIPFIKKYARSVSLNHNYKGTYNIGNYVTNPEYDLETTLNRLRDLQNNFIPQFEVSAVSITEQFSPLFSIDINFLNSLSTRMEIKNSRNIVLSLTNNQLSENISKEFVFGAGYKIKDFQFIVSNKSTGQKGVNSDLNLRGDLSIRDNQMIIRRLTDDPDQATQGQKVVTIKISADYAISANFNLRVFYDRIVNTPFVTTSYPTANTNFGFSVRFSLTQ